MNLQPSQTRLPERFCIPELKQAAAQVIPDVVQMRWNRIRATSEVDVVRKVEGIIKELSNDMQISTEKSGQECI